MVPVQAFAVAIEFWAFLLPAYQPEITPRSIARKVHKAAESATTLTILRLSVVTGSIDINWHDFAAHPGATAATLHDCTAVHARAVSL